MKPSQGSLQAPFIFEKYIVNLLLSYKEAIVIIS